MENPKSVAMFTHKRFHMKPPPYASTMFLIRNHESTEMSVGQILPSATDAHPNFVVVRSPILSLARSPHAINSNLPDPEYYNQPKYTIFFFIYNIFRVTILQGKEAGIRTLVALDDQGGEFTTK